MNALSPERATHVHPARLRVFFDPELALADFFAGGVLADPQLELFKGATRISENDNSMSSVSSAPLGAVHEGGIGEN